MSAKPINSFEMSEQSELTLKIKFTAPSGDHGPQVKDPGCKGLKLKLNPVDPGCKRKLSCRLQVASIIGLS